MAPKWVSVLASVLAIWAVDHADCGHVPAPAPAVDCSTLILDMTDCLSFVSNGSTATKPEGNCCSGFGNVLTNGPSCICEAFKNSAQLGVVLNLTKASTLPAACKLPASQATNCGLPEPPTAAPGSSSSPSAGGSGAAPSPASSSSNSSGSSALSASAGFVAVGVAATIVSLLSF